MAVFEKEYIRAEPNEIISADAWNQNIDANKERLQEHEHTGDGENGPKIKHSVLALDDKSNPHKTTAKDIDTQGGKNRIVAQINAGKGKAEINRENLDVVSGAKGWVRLPFFPRRVWEEKDGELREVKHGFLHIIDPASGGLKCHSVSSGEEAQGVMEIPVPIGAIRVKTLRIRIKNNTGTISIILFTFRPLGRLESLFETTITKKEFDEELKIEEEKTLDKQLGALSLWVKAKAKGTEIDAVAVEFSDE